MKLPSNITQQVGKLTLLAGKVSPTALFVAGTVGVVGAGVLACRATLKLNDLLDDTRHDLDTARRLVVEAPDRYSEEDYRRDKITIVTKAVVNTARLYAPALVIGGISIGLLTQSHTMLTRRNLALTAAYAALERSYKEYRARVIDAYGEDKDQEFRIAAGKKIAEEHAELIKTGTDPKQIDPNVPSQYARFFDETCDGWSKDPNYNKIRLLAVQNWCNELLRSRGHVFLNEVYDELGIERSKAGCVVGWSLYGDGDKFIDFGVFDGTSEPKRAFVNEMERSVFLDFNVDGIIYDRI